MNAHAFLFLNTLKSDILSQLSLKNLLKLFSDYQKDIKLPRINNKGKISGEEYPNNNHEIYSKLLKAIIIHIKNPIQKNLNLSDICPMFKFFLIPLSFHPHSHEIDEFFHSIEYFIYFYICIFIINTIFIFFQTIKKFIQISII